MFVVGFKNRCLNAFKPSDVLVKFKSSMSVEDCVLVEVPLWTG